MVTRIFLFPHGDLKENEGIAHDTSRWNTDGAQSQGRNNTQKNFFPPTANFINTFKTTEFTTRVPIGQNVWLVVPLNTDFNYLRSHVYDECKQTTNHDHDI